MGLSYDDHTYTHVFHCYSYYIIFYGALPTQVSPFWRSNVMCTLIGRWNPAKGLLNAINKLFYERCGVATVDMSFPSNELMFGGFFDEIDEYPVIIFKEPYLGWNMWQWYWRPLTASNIIVAILVCEFHPSEENSINDFTTNWKVSIEFSKFTRPRTLGWEILQDRDIKSVILNCLTDASEWQIRYMTVR